MLLLIVEKSNESFMKAFQSSSASQESHHRIIDRWVVKVLYAVSDASSFWILKGVSDGFWILAGKKSRV